MTDSAAKGLKRWRRQLGRAWRLARKPKRLAELARKAWRLARREGWRLAWTRAKRKLKPPPTEAEGRSAWLEAYHALAAWVAAQGPRPLAIVLSPIDWAWMPQRPQGLARAMAEAGWCVAFTTPQLRGDEVDHWRPLGEGLVLLADPGLLADRPGLLVLGMHPQAWQELARFRAPWLVFDVLDVPELTAGGGLAERAAWRALLAHAEVVLASAQALRRLAERLGRQDVRLVPNAAQPERWAQASPDPSAWGGGEAPVALYAGAIAEWLDMALLGAVAQALPHWRFVLVGPDFDGSASALPRLPNVRWLGLLPGEALPPLYAAATALFVPFRMGPLTEATSPVKAFEAWAAGLPVVATPLPELKGHSGALLAADAPGLAAALEEAARMGAQPGAKAHLIALGAQESWAARVGELVAGLKLRAAARAHKDHLVILAGVPLDDSGGGQRPAMLARAFLALGWRVSYAHRFAKAEHGDAGLLAAHPWLELSPWEGLRPDALAPDAPGPWPGGGSASDWPEAEWRPAWALGQGPEALAGDWRREAWAEAMSPPEGARRDADAWGGSGGFRDARPQAQPKRWVLLAFPHPDAEALVAAFQAQGYRVCLDLIDAWEEAGLGADWFEPQALARLARGADALVASAKPLVAQLQGLSPGRAVAHVPNAVRAERFDPTLAWARPLDLPPGGPVLLYVGALWGAWVDQALLRRLAKAWPEAQVVLVGDGPPPEGPEPPNLHRLGLKAQDELPAYLAHAEVALVPFRVDALTAAVSPLKAYEYLAMGLPVVSTWLPELEGLPGVRLTRSPEAFVSACWEAAGDRLSPEACAAFREKEGWLARAESLLAHWAASAPLALR